MLKTISLDYMQIQMKKFAAYISDEKSINDPLISKDALIYKVGLKNGQRNYPDININERTDRIFPENRLTKDHYFLPLTAFYFLTHVNVSESGNAFKGNLQWFTYPDPNHFTDVAGTVKNSDCLNTIFYGGTLSLEIDGKKAIREVQAYNFLHVPERPWQSAAASGETNPVPQQFSGLSSAAYRLDTEVILKGGGDQKLNIQLGEGNVTNLEGGNTDANIKTELYVGLFGLRYGADMRKDTFCALKNS